MARKVRKDRLHLRSNLYINFKDLDYPNFDFCVPNIFQDQDFQTNRHFVHYNKLQRVRSVHSRAKWLFAKFGPIYGFGDLSCLPSSRVIIVNQGPGLVGSQMGVSQSELELAETER